MTAPSRVNPSEVVPLGVDLFNYSKSTVSLSTTSAKSAALSEGWYDVESDAACFLAAGPEASAVATTSGYPVPASSRLAGVYVRKGHAIAAILASGTGTLTLHKVG